MELKHFAPSLIEEEGDQLVIKHLYIERRMVPLNMFLSHADEVGDDAAMEHGIIEYGNAIKDLVAANIFPGDMLYKNFGVTRHKRVVFYDYDEIEYLTDCNFRVIPAPRNGRMKCPPSRGTRSESTTCFPSSSTSSCSGTRKSENTL